MRLAGNSEKRETTPVDTHPEKKVVEPQAAHPRSGLPGRGDKPALLASGRTAGAEPGAGEG